jgi:TPR repeat protein
MANSVLMTEEIQDWYRILGLEPGSSVEVVKRTYRNLVKQWHPDQFQGHSAKTREANERLKDIIPAYENLIAFHNGLAPRTRSRVHSKPSPPPPKDAKAQFEEGKQHQKAGDHESALNLFRIAAQRGYVDAMFELGGLLFEGYRVKRDYSEAARWYQLAADKGHAQSQFKLGSIFEYGYGLAADYKEALRWYLKAAEQGYAEAQLSAGWLYKMLRPGIKEDYRLADFWLRKAAAQGLTRAELELGYLYQSGGKGVEQNFTEAASWYRRAAEKGDEHAQYFLAGFYEKGLGVSQDEHEADRWLRHSDWAGRLKKEARAGLATSQASLGHMYETGIGIERDLSEAVKWYRKASMWGLTNIQIKLAKLYATGSGTTRNLAEAFKWLTIANRPNDQEVKALLESLATEMNEKDIKKAKELASRFVSAVMGQRQGHRAGSV